MAAIPANANGTLTTSSADLYTPGGSNKGYVVNGSFANLTSGSVTVTITATLGGTKKTLVNAATVPANGALTLGPELKPIVLKNGDKISALASANSAIDYSIFAVETP